METITKREFWLGISIIALSMIVVNFIYPKPIESVVEVKVKEVIICTTNEEGVVNCQN